MVKLGRVISSLSSRAASGRWNRVNAAVRRQFLIERTSRRVLEIAANPSTRFVEVRGFQSATAWFGGQDDMDVTVDYSAFPEREFHKVANETLHHLQEKIDEYGEKLVIDGFDTDYAEGVLTVRLGDLGTYVINKQTPNRQIWLSSPLSGPARFDWQDSQWVYRRTKAELQSLLEKELTQLLGQPINLE